MAFQKIDMETWKRREFYQHYAKDVVCTYSMTVDIDISNLRGERLYPAMLWLLTEAVNAHEAFRTQLSPEGPGIFDAMNPSYTIFNRENKNFSVIWTEFSSDYREFLRRYAEDTRRYANSTLLFPKGDAPENAFDVSMLPWIRFSSFNLNIFGGGAHLLPIFTMGKTFEREGATLLPLSLQVHHAVCDGFHAALFIDTLQEKICAFKG